MNIFFNELSFLPLTDSDFVLKEKFLSLLKLYKELKINDNKCNIVFPTNLSTINVTSSKTFFEWIDTIPHQGDKDKIISIIKKPFSDEVLAEQLSDLDYYFFENGELNLSEHYCYGLPAAHMFETLSISLSMSHVWSEKKINLVKIIDDLLVTSQIFVFNLAIEPHLQDAEILAFIISKIQPVLIESKISPDDKKIHFRDDHGIDKLSAFASKIKQSPYIIEIINSLEFNSKFGRFIRRVFPDGKIELVLHWEDEGFGMVIQTTGRNLAETESIALLLKTDYDK